MRIYVFSAPGVWAAVTPDVPGGGLTGHEERPSRDEAVERCRAFAAAEVAAYERLGTPLEVTPGEEIIDFSGPWWLIGEWLIPIRPAQLRAAVARMDEIADEVERTVTQLPPATWDHRTSSEWSIRLTLDHIASGFVVGVQQLEPFPLDHVEAHADAFDELASRLRSSLGRNDAVLQFGLNQENARVRWTPRKVVRNVRALQETWQRHLGGDGPQPRPPFGHDDTAGDDEPLEEADLAALAEGDRALRPAVSMGRAGGVSRWYRFYRDRLTIWPDDELMRWRATYTAFRQRLLSADDTDLARVRLAPAGPVSTVRGELRIGIGHVLGHLAQIRALEETATV